MFCAKVLLFIIISYSSTFADRNELIFRYRNRNERFCDNYYNSEPFYRKNILENPWYLFFLIFLGMVFILLFLGFIKGIIGLYCSKTIGELGLSMLVDLPKPLEKYQEEEYKHLPVQYDIAGWPINPYTNERTVRVISKKTGFCLNLVFFLAYPFALVLLLCSLCCCIRNYKEADEKGCFKSVNVIKYNENLRKKDPYKSPGQKLDMYADNDKKEFVDTNYVINVMKQSQMSLQNRG